jgi:hypothetical protein
MDLQAHRRWVYSAPFAGLSNREAALGRVCPCGGVAEWLKAHAWKVCIRETVSRVRIPLPPPGTKRHPSLLRRKSLEFQRHIGVSRFRTVATNHPTNRSSCRETGSCTARCGDRKTTTVRDLRRRHSERLSGLGLIPPLARKGLLRLPGSPHLGASKR